MAAARAEGIALDRLHDFLSLEDGGELTLLGQDELNLSVVEQMADAHGEGKQFMRWLAAVSWPSTSATGNLRALGK